MPRPERKSAREYAPKIAGFRWTKLDTLIIAADTVYMLTLCCALGDSFIAGIKY